MPTGNGQPRTYDTTNAGDWTPGNSLFSPTLVEELRAEPALAGNQVDRVDTNGATLEVDVDILLWFPSVLSGAEETAADAVVLAHNATAPPETPDMESDGTETDGTLLIYNTSLTPPAYQNAEMSGDATIDENGVITLSAAAVGDVDGPGSSTDDAITRFDGTTGKLIKNSNAILDDTGNVDFAGTLTGGDLRVKHDTVSDNDIIIDANGRDGAAGASISRDGASGFFHLFPNSEVVQWIAGNPAAANGDNDFYIDVDNQGILRLQTLPGGGKFGDIIATNEAVLYPATDELSDLGQAANRWGNLYLSAALNLSNTGGDQITVQAQAAAFTGYTLTLPPNDGDADQVLTTDGAGVLTWETPDAGVPSSRTLTAGDGLSGGGDLTADRTFTVNTQNSVDIQADSVELLNDEASPGNFEYYGTDFGGTKGFHPVMPEFQSFEDLPLSSLSNGGGYVQSTRFTTSSLAGGDYIVFWSADIGSKEDKAVSHRLQVDDTTTLTENSWRIKRGVAVLVGGQTTAWMDMSGSAVITLTAGTHDFDFDFETADDVYYANVRLQLWRVS